MPESAGTFYGDGHCAGKIVVGPELTPVEYRAKEGYTKGASLACKVKRPRRKVLEMELWKHRTKKGDKK